MAGFTEYYGIAYFDFGDDLGSAANVQLEVNRFVVIDKQLYGMYQVFGDGVIAGWDVIDSGGLNISVNPGTGIINALACESDFAEPLTGLNANTVYNVYAYISNDTVISSSVQFTFTTGTYGSGALLLAVVTTGGAEISNIDNTVKSLVGFKAIIQELVATHRHDGISAPKIDLTSEVQGLLPNDRLDNLDASLITTGRLPTSVMPTIDHNTLSNIGKFEHSGLDAIAQIIQTNNQGFFGEVVTSDVLKAIIVQKYTNANADARFINELIVIPGISPDSVIDFENSTAAIDTVNHCISGIPAFGTDSSGNPITFSELEIVNVSWTTDADFNQAVIISNVVISDGVQLADDGTFNLVIDDFEGTGVSSVVVGGTDPQYKATVIDSTTSEVVFNTSSEQGNLAGFFEVNHTHYAVFTKTFTAPQDWSQYSNLIVNVKNYSATHAAVYLSVQDTSNKTLAVYTLLAADEVTIFANVINNGYATKTFDISGFTRNQIGSIVVYTGNILSPMEAFYLDNIYLQNNSILLPQGNIRFRYNTTAPVVFNDVEFVATIPVGTDFRVRVRVASTLEDLATATFSPLLNSGQTFGLNGTYIEIDIVFLSDVNRLLTPILSELFLTILVPSTESGLSISGANDWNAGTFSNIQVDMLDPANPIDLIYKNVGDIYYANQNVINEIDPNLNPVVGISGNNVPVSPSQGYSAISTQNGITGLTSPKSAVRLINGNYLICDTGNDRVLELQENGTFVRGFGSHNFDYSTTPYLLSASYNPRLGILYVVFSTFVDITNYDLTNITLYYNDFQNTIQLNNSTDSVQTLIGAAVSRDVISGQAPSGTGLTERILVVVLDSTQAPELDAATTPIFIQIVGDLNIEPVPVFNGNFMYFGANGINAPIHAIMPVDNQWLVLNSSITHENDTPNTSTVAAIQFSLDIGEFPPGQVGGVPIGLTYQFNGIVFSDFTLGSAFPLSNNKLMFAGLQALPKTSSSSSSANTSSSSTGVSNAMKLSGFHGVLIVVDTVTNLVAFRYQSPDGLYPSDCVIDENGFYTIAESSLLPQSGRIIKLDPFGNIIFISPIGMFTQINDIRLVENNHLFVST